MDETTKIGLRLYKQYVDETFGGYSPGTFWRNVEAWREEARQLQSETLGHDLSSQEEILTD